MTVEPTPCKSPTTDRPNSWRTLPAIWWAGVALGLVLPIIGLVVETIDVDENTCVPIRTHDLSPLPLSVPVLCWLGLGCAVAGTLAAWQLHLRLRADESPGHRRCRVMVAGGLVVIIVGAAVLFLIYRTVFLTVPICVSEAPVSGFPR